MSEENVEIVRSICEPWAQGDFSSADWAAEDIEFISADGIVRHGIAEMSAGWSDWLDSWADFASVPERYLDAGDDVLVLVSFRGRGKGSGAPSQDFPGACQFTLRDGKVARLELRVDVKDALERLGLSE